MLKGKLISVILILGMLGIIIYLAMTHQKETKTGYINIKEVYSGFEMKKEMEKMYLKTKSGRDKILDSMKFELNNLLKKVDAGNGKNATDVKAFEKKREEFFQNKNYFEEENEKLSQQYDQQILTQLNQYVKEYGEQHHFTMLLGNDSNGLVMFGSEDLNYTKEVISFINEKYNGAK